ncbi:MAG: uncharacterized protein JWM02_3454 [Frankiales bacterium]|nr:uncharacterized protein [Frankiales bacterium]
MAKPVARLTSPAQMVASLPLWMGYVPTESLVVVCCHEPRGRVGLTMRFDLPAPEHEALVVRDVEGRVRQQKATRVLVAVYTAEPDGEVRARTALVDDLRKQLDDLVVTEAVLVREGRFWSYLCSTESCCPAAGTPVDEARESASVRMLEAENIFNGKVMLPDRDALEASLAGPSFLAAQVAMQRCETAATLLTDALHAIGVERAGDASLARWTEAVQAFRSPPAQLVDMQAAALAVSLMDVRVRDQLAASPARDVPALLALLEQLVRRTPSPYDAPVCALFAWLSYCEGGGADVTIALERALRSDPDYGLAHLLREALLAQVSPKDLRKITRRGRGLERPAC